MGLADGGNRASTRIADRMGTIAPEVRIGVRAVSLRQLGSFGQLEREECVEVLDNLCRAADYLSTIGKVLDAA